jgi:uncharacterized protein YjbI with pentapeptide repeats
MPRRQVPTYVPAAPDLPPELEDFSGRLWSGHAVDGLRLTSSLVINGDVHDLDITECEFESVVFHDCRLAGFRARDARFVRCDMAGIVLEGCDLTRVSFVGCKLSGAVLSGARLQDVQFEDCVADLMTLRMATGRRVAFSGTSLREADLYQAELRESSARACDLSGADFTQAALAEFDLRASTLDGVAGATSLRGVVVAADQLVDLASALAADLGIVVTPD